MFPIAHRSALRWRAAQAVPFLLGLILPGCGSDSASPVTTPEPLPVIRIVVSEALVRLAPGHGWQVQATPVGASGRPLADRPVVWRSEAPAVASVDASGHIVARA